MNGLVSRAATVVLCFLLMVSGALAPVALAEAPDDLIYPRPADARDQMPGDVEDRLPKIDSLLEAEIAARPGEAIPIIIMLRDQPGIIQGEFDIGAAKSLAAETQFPLITELTMIGAENVTQHWIINAISAWVYAPKIAEIAARPDVKMVWLDEKIRLPDPVVEPAPATDPLKVQAVAQAGGTITGVVTDTAGIPVPGARVLGRDQVIREPWAWAWVVTTDADGRYTSPVLPPGTYELAVSPAPGVELVVAVICGIVVEAGVETTVDVTLHWDYGDGHINAPPMWQAGYHGDGIRIAILDTGICPYHPDLDQNKVVAAKDFCVLELWVWDMIADGDDPHEFPRHLRDAENLEVDLRWMDPANDLDLLVVRPDGSLIWGTDPEGLGNHERVFIPEPMDGLWWIAVIEALPDAAVEFYDLTMAYESTWDGHGHGTHVGGTAAGDANPDWNVTGVAPGAYLLN
ncbi:carboxypeptidase regulatory-like domain-containing protein, partial [Dehalococcoidia bacterium]|nr:carboxypeptidase regulatory-like domain-containing protein [Dehalococcoidia bacterium]